jgi:hypothetical protein
MLRQESYQLDYHGPIYAYLPRLADNHQLLPMVLDLNCTTGNPRAEVQTNGWDQVAAQENVIVIAPTYDDYATYSECAYLKRVIDDALSRYPVDPTRIYSVGFSNGGATSGALASTYPHLLAGIGAMGWMIGLQNTSSLTIPFILIQGTNEYTKRSWSGKREIMDDEKEALHDLLLANQMIDRTTTPDYGQTPYWGYPPVKEHNLYPRYHDYDPYGHNQHLQTGKKWQISDYYKAGFKLPFAELVLVEGSRHIPHDCNAAIAWNFLKHFRRQENGQIGTI